MNRDLCRYVAAAPVALCAAAFCFFVFPGGAVAIKAGDVLPPFTVQAEKRCLSRSDIDGRVAIITYETKNTVEVNRPFKKAVLARWRQGDAAAPAIVPVVNCSSFFGFVRSFCADRVAAAAKKEKLTIYVDTDGAMLRDFALAGDRSTIIIADAKGVVRLVHAGRLDAAGVVAAARLVERLLLRQAREPGPAKTHEGGQ